jgi:hypothetical protein
LRLRDAFGYSHVENEAVCVFTGMCIVSRCTRTEKHCSSSLQIHHLEGLLQVERQQHEITVLKLQQAEASLRDVLGKTASDTERLKNNPSCKETALEEQVSMLKNDLLEAQRNIQSTKALEEEVKGLQRQLKRTKEESLKVDEERHTLFVECSNLRKQLTEANQCSVVCLTTQVVLSIVNAATPLYTLSHNRAVTNET